MKSHCYQLSRGDWMRLFLPPLLGLMAIAVLVHLALGKARPGTPPFALEDIVLQEKTRMSHSPSGAAVVFIGDSSCMMDLSFTEMHRTCPQLNACNLGTLSALGLPRFTEFLRSYLATQQANTSGPVTSTNSGSAEASSLPKIVVLLITPEMIRLTSEPRVPHPRNAAQEQKRRALVAEMQPILPRLTVRRWLDRFYGLTGAAQVRNDVADRLIVFPLPGAWGEEYGSLGGIHRYLVRHRGCAIDPTPRPASAVELALGAPKVPPLFLNRCRQFGEAIPAGVQLVVGLTPVPQSASTAEYPKAITNVLIQLKDALHADVALTSLPAALPDIYFSGAAPHLNEAGIRLYSHIMGRSLKRAGLLSASGQPIVNGRPDRSIQQRF